jgi:hypothetical protein
MKQPGSSDFAILRFAREVNRTLKVFTARHLPLQSRRARSLFMRWVLPNHFGRE